MNRRTVPDDRFAGDEELNSFIKEHIRLDEFTIPDNDIPTALYDALRSSPRSKLVEWAKQHDVCFDAGGLFMYLPSQASHVSDFRRVRVEPLDTPFDESGHYILINFMDRVYKPTMIFKRTANDQPVMLLDNGIRVPFLGRVEDAWRMPRNSV